MQVQFDDNIKGIKTFKANTDINCIKYAEEKKNICVGCFDGSINLYNIKTTHIDSTLADNDTKLVDNVVTCITNAPGRDNFLTSSYAGGMVKQWSYDTGCCNFTIKEKRQTMGVVYHPKRAKFFTYGDDGKILLYDEETKKNELIYQPSEARQLDGHTTKIFCVCFNVPKVNEFVSGGWDNVLYFWDVRVPSAVRSISEVFIGGGEGITINKKGTDIVTCEWKRENPMKVWDYKSGKLIEIIKPDAHISQLYSGRYLNDTMVATGGCDTNMLRVINMSSYSTISIVKGLPGGVYSIDFMAGKKPATPNKFDEFAEMPNLAFCTGKYLYEIRYR